MIRAFAVLLVGFHSIIKGRAHINILMIWNMILGILVFSWFPVEQIDFGLELVE